MCFVFDFGAAFASSISLGRGARFNAVKVLDGRNSIMNMVVAFLFHTSSTSAEIIYASGGSCRLRGRGLSLVFPRGGALDINRRREPGLFPT